MYHIIAGKYVSIHFLESPIVVNCSVVLFLAYICILLAPSPTNLSYLSDESEITLDGCLFPPIITILDSPGFFFFFLSL